MIAVNCNAEGSVGKRRPGFVPKTITETVKLKPVRKCCQLFSMLEVGWGSVASLAGVSPHVDILMAIWVFHENQRVLVFMQTKGCRDVDKMIGTLEGVRGRPWFHELHFGPKYEEIAEGS